jgi:hypothetical protein
MGDLGLWQVLVGDESWAREQGPATSLYGCEVSQKHEVWLLPLNGLVPFPYRYGAYG